MPGQYQRLTLKYMKQKCQEKRLNGTVEIIEIMENTGIIWQDAREMIKDIRKTSTQSLTQNDK